MPIAATDERTGNRAVHDDVETSVYARTLAEDVVKDGEVLAEAGIDLGDVVIGALFAAGVDSVKIRSVLTCDSKVGTCAHLLRPLARDRQARRHRRGRRHHRGPVDR